MIYKLYNSPFQLNSPIYNSSTLKHIDGRSPFLQRNWFYSIGAYFILTARFIINAFSALQDTPSK